MPSSRWAKRALPIVVAVVALSTIAASPGLANNGNKRGPRKPRPTPTATATPRPSATVTPRPSATATPRPTTSPTATPRPSATATPRPSATPAPTVAPTPAPTTSTTRLRGIDVSHWQGTINWSSVYASGRRFVMAKASQGQSFVDSKYLINRTGATAAGLKFTAYHFASPDTTYLDAVREADHFVNTAQLRSGNLIPALDLEVTGGLGSAALTRWTMDWLNRVTARMGGVKPMIYSSPGFWRSNLADTRVFADAGYKVLWVAHWGATAPTVPASNWGGHGWTFWQYSNCGSVPGISGCVDENRYNGTDLRPVTIP